MAIRTFSQIQQAMKNSISLSQPALDTKDGSVSNDLFIALPADQISQVYKNIQLYQKTQSLLNSTGAILDSFGSNYGITRDPGHKAAGNAILTFSSILNNISIQAGTTITAKTGVVFTITANITISAATKGLYSSFASSISSQLAIAGISDQYAVQVPVQATNVGTNGNISPYMLIKTSIPGITNTTNIAPTLGGTNPQGDPQYRNQILAGLTGSAAGTSRGYQNALLNVDGVESVFIASAGSPILTRDGTVVQRNTDGSLVVISPGTGGKVDIWIQGTDLTNVVETYTFHDISGTGDITSLLNAHILGQLPNTSNLTPIERRQLFTQNGQLPQQPVDSMISLTGSISGANFVQGVNYELVKDTNPDTDNTAFAQDKLVFTQNFISLVGENVSKGSDDSVDSLVFSNVKDVSEVRQSITITNDLASLNPTNNTNVILPHSPLNTVLRITNLTTGERYIITNQNIDTTTGLNDNGSVVVSGLVLPSPQDLLQTDYTWDLTFDGYVDYFSAGDNEFVKSGIDWGRSNYINFDAGSLTRNGNRYNVVVSRDVERVYSVFYCDQQTATVQNAVLSATSNIKALRQITLSLSVPLVNVVKVVSLSTGLELFATESGGTFSGNVVYLAEDVAQPFIGETVRIYYNEYEIYNIAKNNGSLNGDAIVLSTDDILDYNSVLTTLNNIFNSTATQTIFASYITPNENVIATDTITSMPFIGSASTSTFIDNTSTVIDSRQLVEFNNSNVIVRSGQAYLGLTITNAFSSGGTIAVKGMGWFKISASIPVAQSNVGGLFELASVIQTAIGNVSQSYSVSKVVGLSLNNGSTTQTLSIRGYSISSNTYDLGSAQTLLGMTATSLNLAPILSQNGLTSFPIGSILNIIFYVLAPNTAETIQFTTGRGTLYSKYKYARLDRIDLISGFLNPNTHTTTGSIGITALSQPISGSTYSANYDYFAPVENETLTATYNYNSIMGDATTAIEEVRTLTADVLTRLGFEIPVNVSATIILSPTAINQQAQLIDQATSVISNLITTQVMGAELDYSAFLRVITAINGISGADITVFDYVGSNLNGQGNRAFIQADANQYFSVSNITITIGTR